MHPKSFVSRAPPGPVGELTALPRLPSWILRKGRGGKRWRGEGRKREGREGEGFGLLPTRNFWLRHCIFMVPPPNAAWPVHGDSEARKINDATATFN